MKKYMFIIFLPFLFILGCGEEKKNDIPRSQKDGGTIKMNLLSSIGTLYPPHIDNFSTLSVSNQIYEGLVKINPKTLKVEPAIAKSWETNTNNTIYTFNLRSDVYFHKTEKFKTRKVTAKDVVNCFKELCIAKEANFYSHFLAKKIKGAEKYINDLASGSSSKKNIEGLKILNDSTISIELERPFSGFEKLLTIGIFVIYPTEIYDNGDNKNLNEAIGTGPFQVKKIVDGEIVELVRNENYWQRDIEGFGLPYLDGINFYFNTKLAEIQKFKDKELDLIKDIPVNQISNILPSIEKAKKGNNSDFNYLSAEGLDVKLICFNHKKEIFQDINVRKAFNYAVNREKLVDSILLGDRNIANHGLIPRSKLFGSYEVKGYTFNPSKAKEYLAKAGYPNGQGFPEITIHTINRPVDSITIVESVKMINQTLNINIKLDASKPLKELYDIYNLEDNPMYAWRYNWIADYPDPENFLQLFYGDNISNYNNPKFNSLFEEGSNEPNEILRNEIYLKADQALIDDAAFIPLLYNDLVYLTNKKIKEFHPNSIDYRDFRQVYFEK